ncbi:MAG TPA: peptidoglycan-binding protein [Inquilinus sp.]|nr:peptidoglycan-binding protein [Inquilinus sp.]
MRAKSKGPTMRHPWLSALLAPALCALALVPQQASAEAAKVALVIGNSAYEGGPPLAACDQSARGVGTWLQRQGFQVEQAIDVSSVAMRSAIGNFVTLASGAPQKTAIIYVCTYAAVSNQRLFMLPVDTDPRQPTRLETQGIIVKALLNTLVGTNGVLFADLGMAPDKNAADAVDLLQSGLSPGVHFAFVARNDGGIGQLGHGLPGLLGNSGQDWGRLASAFQAQNGPSRADRLTVFAPPTGPMTTSQDIAGGSAPVPPPAVVAAAAPPPSPPPPAVVAPAPAPDKAPEPPAAPAPATAEVAPPPAPSPAEPPKPAVPMPLQLVPPHLSESTPPAETTTAAADQPTPPAPTPDAAAAPAVATPAAVPPTPRADARTSRIQAALARRGFYAGAPSGRMDSRTKDAIRAFQTTLGDRPTGVLTQIEIAKLLNIGQ